MCRAVSQITNLFLHEAINTFIPHVLLLSTPSSQGDADPEPLDSPTSYAFQGSSDGGTTWETLFAVEDTPPFVDPEETRFHPLPAPRPFRLYRLLITQTAWSKPGNLCGSAVVRDFRMY